MKDSWAPLLTDQAEGWCRGGEAEGQVSSSRRRSFAPSPLLQRPPPRLRKAQIDRTFRHTPVVVHPARGGRRAAPASEASARSRRFDQAASTCERSSPGRTLLLLTPSPRPRRSQLCGGRNPLTWLTTFRRRTSHVRRQRRLRNVSRPAGHRLDRRRRRWKSRS